jgi:hypothetical protein
MTWMRMMIMLLAWICLAQIDVSDDGTTSHRDGCGKDESAGTFDKPVAVKCGKYPTGFT